MCAGNRSMWFWLAIIALLCWSGSDLFSKIGCRDGRDKYNPLKMVIAVGVVMGIHAAYEIFVGGAVVTWHVMWTYLPVSLLYIGSMTLGYVGLRYIELSISSPICNSSGALVAVLCLITGTLDESITGAMRWMVIGAVALVCIGVVGLGIVESREDDELRKKRQECSNYKYAKSWLALCLPVAYCLLDAAGTFADSLVLRTLNEDSANCAYELTFLAAAVICFIYVVIIKKDKLVFKAEAPKYAGALFETAGQFAYIYALADEAHVALSAPIISAYCAASVLWSRIFLKEKLSWKHYVMIALVVIGIVMIGIFDIRQVRKLPPARLAGGSLVQDTGFAVSVVFVGGSSSCPASFGSAKGTTSSGWISMRLLPGSSTRVPFGTVTLLVVPRAGSFVSRGLPLAGSYHSLAPCMRTGVPSSARFQIRAMASSGVLTQPWEPP